MADDNAGLLQNYIAGYIIIGDSQFRDTAQGILTYTKEVLSDPHGGFYASQDADVTPDDEGGYFTWTHEEFRNVLSKEEFEVLSAHLLDDRAVMHMTVGRMRCLFHGAGGDCGTTREVTR